VYASGGSSKVWQRLGLTPAVEVEVEVEVGVCGCGDGGVRSTERVIIDKSA
jgi:hypothetical protein